MVNSTVSRVTSVVSLDLVYVHVPMGSLELTVTSVLLVRVSTMESVVTVWTKKPMPKRLSLPSALTRHALKDRV